MEDSFASHDSGIPMQWGHFLRALQNPLLYYLYLVGGAAEREEDHMMQFMSMTGSIEHYFHDMAPV